MTYGKKSMLSKLMDKTFSDDEWKLPFSTLMLVLMIFFMVLFAMLHGADRVSFEKSLIQMSREFGGQRSTAAVEAAMFRIKELEFINSLLEHDELGDMAEMRITMDEEEINLSFSGPVLFDVGQADLKEVVVRILDIVGPMLSDVPNRIIIEGHTCDLPIMTAHFRSNWELSIARALSVKRYLSQQFGINRHRFALAGYGEFHPVAPNISEENRAENRRIAFRIIRIT